MDEKLRAVLSKAGALLDAGNILWGVGASVLLWRYGLVEAPRDIDIMVGQADAERAARLLDGLGTRVEGRGAGPFVTEHFYEFDVDGVEVDVMGGFAVRYGGGVYRYRFDARSVPRRLAVAGHCLPFMSLEEWLALYLLMPGREQRAALIERHLRERGLEYPALLRRMLESGLPQAVARRLAGLLEGNGEPVSDS